MSLETFQRTLHFMNVLSVSVGNPTSERYMAKKSVLSKIVSTVTGPYPAGFENQHTGNIPHICFD